MFGRDKNKIKVNEAEKSMFNALWEIYENQNHLGIKNFPRPPEEMVDEFVHYLSLKYRFDPNNFTIYDNKGKFLHTRVEKPKESVN